MSGYNRRRGAKSPRARGAERLRSGVRGRVGRADDALRASSRTSFTFQANREKLAPEGLRAFLSGLKLQLPGFSSLRASNPVNGMPNQHPLRAWLNHQDSKCPKRWMPREGLVQWREGLERPTPSFSASRIYTDAWKGTRFLPKSGRFESVNERLGQNVHSTSLVFLSRVCRSGATWKDRVGRALRACLKGRSIRSR